MSPLAIGQPAGWDGVTTVLEKIHAGGESFEQFLHRQLDELESLRVGMEQRERWLEEERQKLRQAERQFQAQSQSRQELVALSEKAAAAETAGEELVRLQAALTESERSAAARQELDARSVEFAALERQVRELDNERSLLETELETVRQRTVELAETAAAERARMAEEREHWSRELKQLRKNSERPQTAPAAVVAPVAAVSTTQLAGASPAAAATIDGDPMLESVMAQFDMLRKDIARRRINGKTPTR